jgi:ribosomal protein L37AE/L43A
MMLLEATFANGGKSPRLSDFPHNKVRDKLLKEGQLHWQECEILDKEERGYISKYKLRCPLCHDGIIEREKDSTPGFKESDIWPCNICNLSGSGTYLDLESANSKYKNQDNEGA